MRPLGPGQLRHCLGLLRAAPCAPCPSVTCHPTSCCFSCEELQDINLELNVDNSAFYDQFAIAQVGGAVLVGGAFWWGGCSGGGLPGAQGSKHFGEGSIPLDVH